MIRDMQRHIARAIGNIRLAFRARLARNNCAGPVQLAQAAGLADELLQNVELMQQFGLTSHPPAGTQCVVLPVGGKTSHSLIIATEHGDYRMRALASGEVAIYNQWGDHVLLRTDRRMQVVSALAVDITTPLVTMSGDLHVAGSVVAQGDVSDHGVKSMLGMRNVYNAHTHSDPQGGQVSAPAGQM